MDKKLIGLRKFNIAMAVLHFGQGLAMLMLSNNFRLPVYGSFLRFDGITRTLLPSPSKLFTIQVAPAIAIFLFISAAAHLAVSLPKINGWYNRNLGRGINFARWIEYFFSSSIMMVIIAMLVGVYDIVALLGIFFLNGAMILFGWMMELHNQSTQKTNWTSYIFGCIAGIVPWVGVGIYLFGAHDKPPTFVYWIYFSIFVFFNCFAVNQLLQYKKVGKWSDYLYGERVYIILSLVAKSLLAWQVFAGTLRPM